MKLLDLKKQYKHLYQPSAKKIETVQVPPLQFAMVDGAIEKGSEPGKSPSFAEATQALYSISYTLKFMLKKRKTNAIDYPVMALEGLWWVEDGMFDITIKDNWFYTLMILQPDVVTPEIFEEAREQVCRKRERHPPSPGRVWPLLKKAFVRRSCTSDRMPRSRRRSSGCAPICRNTGCGITSGRTASITRST